MVKSCDYSTGRFWPEAASAELSDSDLSSSMGRTCMPASVGRGLSFVELHLGRSVELVSRRLAPLAVVHMGQKHERFRNGTADRGGQLIQVFRAICATDCERLGLLASIVAATLHAQG